MTLNVGSEPGSTLCPLAHEPRLCTRLLSLRHTAGLLCFTVPVNIQNWPKWAVTDLSGQSERTINQSPQPVYKVCAVIVQSIVTALAISWFKNPFAFLIFWHFFSSPANFFIFWHSCSRNMPAGAFADSTFADDGSSGSPPNLSVGPSTKANLFDDKAESLLYGPGINPPISPFDQAIGRSSSTRHLREKHMKERITSQKEQNPSGLRKKWLWLGLLAFVVIACAVAIPVGVVFGKRNSSKHNNNSSNSGSSSSSSSNSSSSDSGSSSSKIPVSAQGSILDTSTWLDKTDFNLTYTNATVGGLSIMGLNSSWTDNTTANSYAPHLSSEWNYTKTPMRGVNLGGWLVLEPFITPSFFNYSSDLDIVDEYTLSVHLRGNSTTGSNSTLKSALEKHYSTFVTEQTFAEIADAGLDHVRIPYPYWLVKTYSGDPYLAQVGWRYLLRGIEWARKYGIRVVLDLHTVPGSQNGWNHSGREGYPLWLNSTNSNGALYGNESLDLHKQLGAFFAQDRYKNIISMYGLVNEPKMLTLNHTAVINWTSDAYKIVREAGYNNYITFSDGFLGPQAWPNIFNASEYPKMIIDLHEYTIFNSDNLKYTHSAKLEFACNNWAGLIVESTNTETGHGPTIVGEFSMADNDCTKWINSVNDGARWDGTYESKYNVSDAVLYPDCATSNNCTCTPSNQDSSTYGSAYKTFLSQYGQAQMQVFEQNGGWGFIYWTWDVESTASSQWSYKKALANGLLPDKAYDRTYNCSTTATDFVSLGLAESY